MMEKLPEGTVIGEMRAPFDWVLSHTARFAGIVVVTVQESRGFILIDKGKPLGYYFRHGKRVLKGHNAYEYFRSQDAILFELRRYTPGEMTKALEIASAEDKKTPSLDSVFLPGQYPDQAAEGAVPEEEPRAYEAVDETGGVAEPSGAFEETEPGDMEPAPLEPGNTGSLASAVLAQLTGRGEDLSGEPEPGYEEVQGSEPDEPVAGMFGNESDVVTNVGELLLGRIIALPGVIAVSIFKRGMNVLSIGDISLENLIDVAEDLIGSAQEVSSVMKTGPFVQMTLQIPAGNVIIAPYWDEYLCILTRPGINLGQIRKILRDIPAGKIAGPGR